MTPAQKENIPTEILARLFTKNGNVSTKYLTFLQQLYILSQGQLSKIFIHVENPDNGIGMAEWEKFKRKQNGRRVDLIQAEEYLGHGCMVITNNDVAEYLTRINSITLSGAMNYALKMKGTKEPLIPDKETEFVYFTNLLTYYEGNKKKIFRQQQITVPDWYVLLFLSDGEEKKGSTIYNERFADAFNSSKIQIIRALKKMMGLGYIQAFGRTKSATYKITYLGKSKVRDLIKKYVIP